MVTWPAGSPCALMTSAINWLRSPFNRPIRCNNKIAVHNGYYRKFPVFCAEAQLRKQRVEPKQQQPPGELYQQRLPETSQSQPISPTSSAHMDPFAPADNDGGGGNLVGLANKGETLRTSSGTYVAVSRPPMRKFC